MTKMINKNRNKKEEGKQDFWVQGTNLNGKEDSTNAQETPQNRSFLSDLLCELDQSDKPKKIICDWDDLETMQNTLSPKQLTFEKEDSDSLQSFDTNHAKKDSESSEYDRKSSDGDSKLESKDLLKRKRFNMENKFILFPKNYQKPDKNTKKTQIKTNDKQKGKSTQSQASEYSLNDIQVHSKNEVWKICNFGLPKKEKGLIEGKTKQKRRSIIPRPNYHINGFNTRNAHLSRNVDGEEFIHAKTEELPRDRIRPSSNKITPRAIKFKSNKNSEKSTQKAFKFHSNKIISSKSEIKSKPEQNYHNSHNQNETIESSDSTKENLLSKNSTQKDASEEKPKIHESLCVKLLFSPRNLNTAGDKKKEKSIKNKNSNLGTKKRKEDERANTSHVSRRNYRNPRDSHFADKNQIKKEQILHHNNNNRIQNNNNDNHKNEDLGCGKGVNKIDNSAVLKINSFRRNEGKQDSRRIDAQLTPRHNIKQNLIERNNAKPPLHHFKQIQLHEQKLAQIGNEINKAASAHSPHRHKYLNQYKRIQPQSNQLLNNSADDITQFQHSQNQNQNQNQSCNSARVENSAKSKISGQNNLHYNFLPVPFPKKTPGY